MRELNELSVLLILKLPHEHTNYWNWILPIIWSQSSAFTQQIDECWNAGIPFRFFFFRPRLSRAPRDRPLKEKAPQVNANESVKIPIRIKKLYNHNVSPHRRRIEQGKSIEKTLKRREDQRRCRPSELFRYIYYRHHKIIIYYTMFLLCPIVCVCLRLWGASQSNQRRQCDRVERYVLCKTERRYLLTAHRARVSAEPKKRRSEARRKYDTYCLCCSLITSILYSAICSRSLSSAVDCWGWENGGKKPKHEIISGSGSGEAFLQSRLPLCRRSGGKN